MAIQHHAVERLVSAASEDKDHDLLARENMDYIVIN